MPIRPELRHHYTGPAWQEIRARILKRAGQCCERCKAPNHEIVLRCGKLWARSSGRLNMHGATLKMMWRGPKNNGRPFWRRVAIQSTKWVWVKVGIAHLDHNPENNEDGNLAALCDNCHLDHDAAHHRESRQRRKDRGRPLLAVAS